MLGDLIHIYPAKVSIVISIFTYKEINIGKITKKMSSKARI